MRLQSKNRARHNVAAMLFVSALMSACLSGDSDVKSEDETVVESIISGRVGDGPRINASISVFSEPGQKLFEVEGDSSAAYSIAVQLKSKDYPLLITAEGGVDLVSNQAPDFLLMGVSSGPKANSTVNLNVFSTLAVRTAENLSGGLTQDNIRTAESLVVSALNFGLSSIAVPGPMSSPVDETNIAEIVKAAEGLSETIRRTRDLQLMYGNPSSVDSIIEALGSDLIDGVIDGRGGRSANRRVAALFTLAASQVLLESMQNELRVNGQVATNAISRAISDLFGRSPSPMIEDVPITLGAIATVLLGLDASLAIEPGQDLLEIKTAATGLQSGMDPDLIRSLVPDGYAQTLDDYIVSIASRDDAVLEIVNQTARAATSETDSINNPPFISGTPAPSVVAGGSYTFRPIANDPDGDLLTFEVSGRPDWASFDAETGELFGSPGSQDVGVSRQITIGVSDGMQSSSLPPFVIRVTESSSTNSVPTITGNPASQVFANSAYSFVPSATDPDNDPLTFSISGQPAWATFDPLTGELAGTPGQEDIGVYSDIRISVTDAAGAGDVLGPFSISVQSLASSSRPWENILGERVGFAVNAGVNGGQGRQLLTVTNTNDSGGGSLRQAVADAAGIGGGWIRFSRGMTGTIRLNSTINLRSNITIDGRGADISIQGPGGSASTFSSRAGSQNWILMYLKLDGPVGSNNDLVNVQNRTSDSPDSSDATKRFWIYHVSFVGAEDELISFIRTEGLYTVQNSYFRNNNTGNSGYCALISHGTKGNYGWDAVVHKATWVRNHWDQCRDRMPYITVPSNVHIFNNYYYDWGATALHVTSRFNAALPAQLLFDNNIAAAVRHEQLVKPTLSSAIDGDARLDGNLFLNGAFGRERNREDVFTPPYSFNSEPATTALRDEIMNEAGWQDRPFPE